MKSIFFVFFLVANGCVLGQVTIVQPQIHYFSQIALENSDWIKVGARVLFAQECTTDLPREYPTGIVFYENACYGKEQFSMSVEFKDTVIVAVTYYFHAKQAALLKTIGYSDVKGRASAIKGHWTYILDEPTRHTVVVGDRKQIVVVQTIGKNVPGNQRGD